MKKQLCAVLAVVTGTMGFVLHGVDVSVVNATPFKIVKYQLEDEDENLTDVKVDISAGETKKITFSNKGVDNIYFVFENGLKDDPEFEEIKDIRRIKFTYEGVFRIISLKRNARTKYPVGQMRISMSKDVKSFAICPLGKDDEWKSCPVVNAKKNLYTVPKSGKYAVKITTSRQEKPEQIFDNGGKGFDFSTTASLSVSFEGLDCDVTEGDDDDDDDDD